MRAQQHHRQGLWWRAAKPPMYTVAVKPMLLGALAAAVDTGTCDVRVVCTWVAVGVCLIAWVNLTNDVFDFDTGVDVRKKESVVNLCGGTRAARNKVLGVAMAVLGVGLALLGRENGRGLAGGTNFRLIAMATGLGYLYQGPPFRLGYYGLGEPITAAAWTLGTVASYNAQVGLHGVRNALARVADGESCLGAVVGLVTVPTVVILLCSHFHQIEDDAAVGKKSPVVRFGLHGASRILEMLVVALFLWELVMWGNGRLHTPLMMASWVASPWAWDTVRFVKRWKREKEKVRVAKYYAVKWHAVHAMVLAAVMVRMAWKRDA